MDNAKAILEGLLFLSGEEGLTMDQMMHGLQNLEMDDIRVCDIYDCYDGYLKRN